MSDIADLIAELVQTRTSLTQQLSNALTQAERYQDDAEHWKNRYREVRDRNAEESAGR